MAGSHLAFCGHAGRRKAPGGIRECHRFGSGNGFPARDYAAPGATVPGCKMQLPCLLRSRHQGEKGRPVRPRCGSLDNRGGGAYRSVAYPDILCAQAPRRFRRECQPERKLGHGGDSVGCQCPTSPVMFCADLSGSPRTTSGLSCQRTGCRLFRSGITLFMGGIKID